MQRWFSRVSFGADGMSWDAQDTSLPLVEHFVFGSWKAITLGPFQFSTFVGVMWSVSVNEVRDGTVNLPEWVVV